MNKFIVIGHERSGTSVTHHILMNHPNVSGLFDEVNYSPFFDKGISVFTHGLDKQHEIDKGFSKLFDVLISLNETERTEAFGLKVAVNRPSSAKIIVDCIQKYLQDVKIILVLRDDLVDLFGSIKRAKLTGKWHSWQHGSDQDKSKKFKLDEKEFIRFAISALDVYKELFRLKSTHENLIFSYKEDIEKSLNSSRVKLFDFLNIPNHLVEIPIKKMSPKASEYISNYNQLLDLEKKIKEDAVFDFVNIKNQIKGDSFLKTKYNSLINRAINGLKKVKLT